MATYIYVCAYVCYTQINGVYRINWSWLSEDVSRLTVVSREAKEEVPCKGLSTNAREYFTRTNLAKIKNAITYEPYSLALYNSRLINVLCKYNLQTKAKAWRTTHRFVPAPNDFFIHVWARYARNYHQHTNIKSMALLHILYYIYDSLIKFLFIPWLGFWILELTNSNFGLSH